MINLSGMIHVPPLLQVKTDTFISLSKLAQERMRQDKKWGVQTHPLEVWLAILTEEVGEFAEAILHKRFGGPEADNVEAEIIQVGAVAAAIVEQLLREANAVTD